MGWLGAGIGTNVVCATDEVCVNGEEGLSFVPLAGIPAIFATGEPEGAQTALLIVAEVLQVGGLALSIVGLALQVESEDQVAASFFAIGDLAIQLTPLVSSDLFGLMVTSPL